MMFLKEYKGIQNFVLNVIICIIVYCIYSLLKKYYILKRSIKYQKCEFRILSILIKIRIKENAEKITDIVILFFNSFNLVI